jgi:RNA polymerase sigma-70 factor (ECF subfamily)
MQTPHERIDPEEVSRYASSLKRLARALVGDAHLAEDLVQDAWVMALRKPPRAPGALGAWLVTVAQRLARNAGRSSARRVDREERSARTEAEESHALVFERLELQRKVLGLVSSLREPYRTTIYMRYWEELPPKTIAARLGVPVETVKTRLARGLAELRAELDGDSGPGRSTWIAALLPVAFPRELALPIAAGGTAVTAPLTLLGGTLVLKQALLVVVGLVLVFFGWRIGARSGLFSTNTRIPLTLTDESLASGTPKPTEAPLLPVIEVDPSERVAAAAAPEVATGGLVVRLSWSDGSPAADVALEASCEADPATREERFVASTDSEGLARFPSLFAGAIRLMVDRGYRYEESVAAGVTREIKIVLPRGDDVVGRVELSSGEPIAGAEVWLDSSIGLWPIAHRVAITGVDGSFRVRELAGESRLGARASGRIPTPLYETGGLPVGKGGARELVLVFDDSSACGTVIGRVLDPAGQPVANAQVKIGERGGWQLSGNMRAMQAVAVAISTDENGAFRHPGGLPAGELPVYASARGWPVWSGSVVVEAGRTSELEVHLEEAATIVGTVFDSDGHAVPDIDVVASEEIDGGWHFDPLPPPETKTNAEGAFRLEWVAPGERMLVASDWQRQEIGKALGRVQCTAGTTVTVELVLERGVTITGRVTDRGGVALAGWNVYGDPESNPNFGQTYPRHVRTNADGTFVLPNLDAHFAYELKTSAPGEFPHPPRAQLDRVRAGTSEVLLEVANTEIADGHIRGELRDASGGVPRDVWLLLHAAGRDEGNFVDFDAASGAFEYGPLQPGRYSLVVSRGGQTVTTGEPFDVAKGETRDVGLIQMTEGGYLELELSGVPAEALAGLRPELDRDGSGTEDLSFENGRFRSRKLAPGTWILTLGLIGGGWCVRQQEIEIVSGDTTRVALTAEHSVKVPIVCTFADPSAVWKTIEYDVRDADGVRVLHSSSVGPDKDGRLRLHGLALPAGDYELEVWTDTGLRATDDMTIVGPTCAMEREVVLR